MSAGVHIEACADCSHWQYPPRGFCAQCLSANVAAQPMPDSASLLSWTTLHTSLEAELAPHLSLVVASSRLAEGPVVITYFDGAPEKAGQPLRLSAVIGPAGNPVLVAQSRDDANPADIFSRSR